MVETTTHPLKPGQILRLVSHDAAVKIVICLPDGTEFTANLHPGSEVSCKAGPQQMSVSLYPIEGADDGLRLVD